MAYMLPDKKFALTDPPPCVTKVEIPDCSTGSCSGSYMSGDCCAASFEVVAMCQYTLFCTLISGTSGVISVSSSKGLTCLNEYPYESKISLISATCLDINSTYAPVSLTKPISTSLP